MKVKRFSSSLLGLLILALGILAGILLIGRQQIFIQKAAPSTHLTLIPSKTEVRVNEDFDVYLTIETGKNEVVGGEFRIIFAPASHITVSDITLGDFLPNAFEETKEINSEEGTISYVIFIFPSVDLPFVKGSGNVAILHATAREAGNVTFSFADNSVVAGVGESAGQNILQGTSSATVRITDDDQQASNSIDDALTTTLTNTPTPTPSVSAGDANGDDCITFTDFWLVVGNVGEESADSVLDINRDGRIGWNDAWSVLAKVTLSCKSN